MKKPIHPMLVHFPIALLVTSFLADAAYFVTSLATLQHVGWWMLAVAAGTGVFTVLAGIFDMRRVLLDNAVHERVHQHMWVGITLFAVICVLTVWRWTFFDGPNKPVTTLYLDAAFLAVVLAAFQGWLGGELVYTHGVFVGQQQKDAAGASNAGAPDASGDHHSH